MINRIRIRGWLFIIAIIPLTIAIFASRPFPKTIFLLTEPEIYQINERRSYYRSATLGRLTENKITWLLYKYKKNLFQIIDQNYYFFANHPRERAGIKETQFFHWLFLIPFFFGLYYQIKKGIWWAVGYFFLVSIIISIFENPDQFICFVIPFIILTICFGLWKIVSLKIMFKK